jgi:DNA-binding beta-propeller fold protein YncE
LFLLLAVVAGGAAPAAAQDRGAADPVPSLEYRPPRAVIPEPKAPHPAPPLTVFREAIGGFGMLTGSFDGPVDVARDKSGNFYVLDAGNNRVQKFDQFANFKSSWGKSGIRDGEFNRPTAIALNPAGGVYVVDTGNDRIQKFDEAGVHIKSWGSRGRAEGDFKSPQDIAFDQDGNAFVLDSGNERVQFFDADFTFLSKWERSFGVTGGVFTDLKSIAWSGERFSYLYLLSAGCLVQQFKLDGTLVTSWPAIAPESGLCVPARLEVDDKNHYVYVLDSGNGLLLLFNPDGLYRAALRGAEQPFSKSLGFAVDSSGEEFLVADTGNNIVQKFTLR